MIVFSPRAKVPIALELKVEITMPADWIVWDWNGTLLDDTSAALAAFNEQLTRRGLKSIDLDFYRAHFAFPVKPFYALCGIKLEQENWPLLAREYHEAYARQPKALNHEARSALEAARALGLRQCVLSALRQDLLDAALVNYGVADYFEFAYGVDNLDGASKLSRARDLISRLQTQTSRRSPLITFIGDAIHDQEVASALGAKVVLCAVGGHSAERLRAVAPTVNSLMEAVKLCAFVR